MFSTNNKICPFQLIITCKYLPFHTYITIQVFSINILLTTEVSLLLIFSSINKNVFHVKCLSFGELKMYANFLKFEWFKQSQMQVLQTFSKSLSLIFNNNISFFVTDPELTSFRSMNSVKLYPYVSPDTNGRNALQLKDNLSQTVDNPI